ncbi:zinc-binding dehydrogenase [Streptomyces thinghirensis]|nr:zinc-binding dehydrogenase [Streptomyces thinghirensis]
MRPASSTRWPAGAARGRRGRGSLPGTRRHPGLPVPGDLVWGIWGHRSEGVVPAERMIGHTLPTGLEPLAGAFARVGAIAYNAVLAGDIHLGEDVAVFGQGVIGLLTTRLARLSGARVTAVDALDGRLETAKRPGAKYSLNARTDAVAERVRETTGGLGADLAIEISGAYPALHEALRSVAAGGGCGGLRLLPGRRHRPAPRRRVPPQPGPADLLPDRRRPAPAVEPLDRRTPPADLPAPGRRGPGGRRHPGEPRRPRRRRRRRLRTAGRAARRGAAGRPGIPETRPLRPDFSEGPHAQDRRPGTAPARGHPSRPSGTSPSRPATTRSNCAARATAHFASRRGELKQAREDGVVMPTVLRRHAALPRRLRRTCAATPSPR